MEYNEQTLAMVATWCLITAFITFVIMTFKGMRDSDRIYREEKDRKKERKLEQDLEKLDKRIFKIELDLGRGK